VCKKFRLELWHNWKKSNRWVYTRLGWSARPIAAPIGRPIGTNENPHPIRHRSTPHSSSVHTRRKTLGRDECGLGGMGVGSDQWVGVRTKRTSDFESWHKITLWGAADHTEKKLGLCIFQGGCCFVFHVPWEFYRVFRCGPKIFPRVPTPFFERRRFLGAGGANGTPKRILGKELWGDPKISHLEGKLRKTRFSCCSKNLTLSFIFMAFRRFCNYKDP